MSIQCGGAGGTGRTGGTRRGRRKARREGKEDPGEGASRCRPRVNRQRRKSSQEDPGGAHRQVETVKYEPRGRVADWEGAAVRRGVDDVADQGASAQQAKSTVHVGCANNGTAGTATCGARVERGSDGKAREVMPCTAERCPTRLSRSPAHCRRRLPRRHRRR